MRWVNSRLFIISWPLSVLCFCCCLSYAQPDEGKRRNQRRGSPLHFKLSSKGVIRICFVPTVETRLRRVWLSVQAAAQKYKQTPPVCVLLVAQRFRREPNFVLVAERR